MTNLRILIVASEVAPFAKTGGLADVTSALAVTLSRAGHDVRVVLPRYGTLRSAEELEPAVGPEGPLTGLTLDFGGTEIRYGFLQAPIPGSDRATAGSPETTSPQRAHFIDCPQLYDRAEYYTDSADEPVRFAFLCRAALALCQHTGWAPDIVHANDWHTGLLPIYLNTLYAWDKLFENTKTLLTIHNIAYQGMFPEDCLDQLGLAQSRDLFFQEDLQHGYVNFLKTGILYADALTTVSPTYANEIRTPEFGVGLEELLEKRADHLVGILNGVDYGVWSPEHDRHIPHAYDVQNPGPKQLDREALLARFELQPHFPSAPELPVIGIVSRLTGQKGFEILPDVLPVLLQRDALYLCVLGSGEERYERYFQWLRDAFPGRVGFYRGYDDPLAHLIEAGSDMFLMPSRYEPCGLNQMYSLRYGTIPIVRKTGGLADTVQSFDSATRTGTGFVFDSFDSRSVHGALERALDTYAVRDLWSALMRNAMQMDFSWDRQAAHYVELYTRLLAMGSKSHHPSS